MEKNNMIFRSMSKNIVAIVSISFLAVPTCFATDSSNTTLSGGVNKTTQGTWGQRHPKMKAAAIGGGIGAAAGGATGLLTHRGVVKGAAIGAGTGAGVGALRKTAIAKRHPIVSDAGTGLAAGAGLGLISGHKHMTAEGALIGGAAGLGVGLWKDRKNL